MSENEKNPNRHQAKHWPKASFVAAWVKHQNEEDWSEFHQKMATAFLEQCTNPSIEPPSEWHLQQRLATCTRELGYAGLVAPKRPVRIIEQEPTLEKIGKDLGLESCEPIPRPSRQKN